MVSNTERQKRLYQEAAEKYPESVFAKYCDFYAAARCESWEWEDAIRHYRNVIQKYPVFRLTDDATLGLAKVYLENSHYIRGRAPSVTSKPILG